MTEDKKPPVAGRMRGLTRRRLLTRGAAVGAAGLVSGVTGLPVHQPDDGAGAGSAAEVLAVLRAGRAGGRASRSGSRRWSPTGTAATSSKIELEYVPNNDYMDGTQLPTAFASGEGPDLFIISPGDFLRYYNGGVLLDLTPFIEEEAQGRLPGERDRQPHGRRQDLWRSRWRSSRWRCTTRSRPSRRPGSTRTTCRRPGTSCSRSPASSPPTSATACCST